MTLAPYLLAWALLAQSAALVPYTDPQNRFRFSYPARYGTASRGTNDGFESRVAAIRFSAFPSTLGGEVALTQGPPVIDLQGVGGLYDPITLEVFPTPVRALITGQLPVLTARTLCAALAQPIHLNPNAPALASLPALQRNAIGTVDAMRNVDPKVIRCQASGDVVVFDKEVSLAPGSPRQRLFGAVRFLDGRYSTVQIVAGGAAPDLALLSELDALVRSFAALP